MRTIFNIVAPDLLADYSSGNCHRRKGERQREVGVKSVFNLFGAQVREDLCPPPAGTRAIYFYKREEGGGSVLFYFESNNGNINDSFS